MSRASAVSIPNRLQSSRTRRLVLSRAVSQALAPSWKQFVVAAAVAVRREQDLG